MPRQLAARTPSFLQLVLVAIAIALLASTTVAIAPIRAELGPLSLTDPASAQSGTCPAGSNFLTSFNWSSGPGGSDDPASADGATWPVNTTNKTWTNVGGSGLDVNIVMSGTIIDATNGQTVGPGAVGTIDGFPTSTNEGSTVGGADGAYGSDYLTLAMYSESSDDLVNVDFNFSIPVFFANDFTVDDVDWIGHNFGTNPIPAGGFQDEVAFTATDAAGNVPVTVTPLGTATNISGQSAKGDVYDPNADGNVTPNDLDGQVLVTTPKPFTTLRLDYSNGPDDQATELADPNVQPDWDGVSNGHAVRLGGFSLCEPDPAGITLEKTVYEGHDTGAACNGSELITGMLPGEDVTYCFEVTNSGDTFLDTITIDDPDLALVAAGVPPLGYVGTPTFPMAPGATITMYYEAAAPVADLVNSATATGIPVYADGTVIPFQNPVDDTNTAEVQVAAPGITLVKDVIVGHQAGANCALATNSASIISGAPVTYCFTVTNSGDTALDNINIQDATLGSPAINQTVTPLPSPLLPGATVVFYFETTATTSLTNTAAVSADPVNPDGTPISGATPVTDDDTAIVTEETTGIQLEKTASVDGTCPGVELATQVVGDALSYCFEVTNTGTTSLANVTIADADIPGYNPANLIPVSGSLALIAPGASAVVRYDTTATIDVLPNTATATGTPSDGTGTSLGLGDVDDDDTASVEVVSPAVSLIKTAVPVGTTCPGIDGSTLQVAAGSDVVYCFTVTNTGDTDLINMTLSDPTLLAAGIDVSTITVPNLAPGASTTVASAVSPASDLTNTASVSATPADGTTPYPGLDPVTDGDDAVVDVLTPGISLVKTVVGGGNINSCPGSPSLNAGSGVAITYCFEVTNTGETYLDVGNMTLNDPTLGTSIADLTAIGAVVDPLPPGGTITYAYTTTMSATLTNTAEVRADPVDSSGTTVPGSNPVSDIDTADVVLASPAIDIIKTAYAGHDTGAGCPGTDTTTVNVGADLTYCFIVTNTSSDVALANVVINDPLLGVAYPGAITLLSGDPTFLDVGETAVFYLETTATNDITNVADTTGTPVDGSGNPIPATPPTDDDPTTVDVVGAGIGLEKTVYLGHDTGASCDGGELSTGITGSAVTFCFTITNTGDTHLANVAVSDPLLGISLTAPGVLAPGASVTVFHETTITGDVLNTATAGGTPSNAAGTALPGIAPPSADDTAEVAEIDPSVTIDKTVYADSDAGISCPTAPNSALTVAGDTVTYCFEVTNTGDTYLSDLVITDTTLGITIDATNETALSGTLANLAPGATAVLYLEVVAGTADVANIASVTGNPTDPLGGDLPGAPDPTDTDDALLNVVSPSVTIAKTVSTNGTCPGVESVDLVAGSSVSFCFEITNTGDTHLADLTIDDDIYGILDATNTSAVSGTLALIGPGATVVVRYDTTSPAADQVNTASTTGTPADNAGTPLGLPDATSPEDTAEILVIGPALELIKTAIPAGATCGGLDGAVLEVATGSQVIYCFEVTNTGDTYLTNINVDDPTLGIIGLVVPDLPANGDSEIVSFGPVAAADMLNTAQATGEAADAGGTPLSGVPPVDDTEVAEVDVLTPAIELQKTVLPGTNLNNCPGGEIVTAQSGVDVVYCFEVTNTGDAPLNNIVISDPDIAFGLGDPTLVSGSTPLAPGATATYAFATTISGDLVNTATATGNPTDSNGDALPGGSSVSDTDTAEVVQADPSITIVKTVYAGHDSGASCGGTNLVTGLNGAAVTYCFEVTNTSASTTLSSVVVNDPTVGPVTLIASGDTLLSPGESATFYVDSTITGDLVNTATAEGTPSDNGGTPLPGATPTESAPDTAEVQEVGPGIDIDKTVYTGHDAGASCAGIELVSGLNGDAVTYCFTVTNTGDTHLNNVTVNDSTFGLTLAAPGPIAPGATATVIYETTIAGDLTNTASATGTPSNAAGAPITGLSPINSGNDDAAVEEINPSIDLAKTVYAGHDAGAGCAGTELVSGNAGDLVTYCFEVTNTGDTPLNVAIEDGTLGLTAAGTQPTAITPPSVTPLAPGDTGLYFYESVLSGDLVNSADAVGTPTDGSGNPIPGIPSVSDNDTAAVDVVNPSIEVAKTVTNSATCPGTEFVSGLPGDAIIYCFTVTNTGDTALSDVTLDDTTLGIDEADMVATAGTLALIPVGGSVTLEYATTIAGDLTNTVTASGTPSDPGGTPLGIPDVNDDDTAEVNEVGPAVTLAKTVSTNGTCAGVELAGVVTGAPLTYCFEITNSGDTHLNGVTLTDPLLGLTLSDLTLLAPGDSVTLTAPATASLDVVNTAAVSATPTDPTGSPLPNVDPVTDDDPATVDVLDPSVELVKTVSASGTCPGVGNLTGGAGIPLTYCFEVNNDGTTHLDLTGMTFADATLGITETDLTLVSSDSTPLAPGDSALYSYSGATLPVGGLVNTADVSADPVDSAGDPIPGPGGPAGPVDDSDTAEVVESDSAIAIVKTIYTGHDAGAGCPGVDSETVGSGAAVTYCFTVTNTSATEYLADVVVDDTTLGAAYPGSIVLLSGDPSLLAPSASAVFYFEDTATADLTNIATTTGRPSDGSGTLIPTTTDPSASDDADVDVVAPDLTIEKTVYEGTNSGALCGSPSADDLASGTAGQPVTYCFTVTNSGDTFINGVTVDDSVLGISLSDPTLLAPGDSVTLFADSTLTNDLVNTATSTGTPSDPSGTPFPDVTPPTSGPDDAEVNLVAPAIQLDKTVYAGTHDGGARCTTDAGELASGTAGDPITWCFLVTNTGDTALASVVIDDATLAIDSSSTLIAVSGAAPLAPGDTMLVAFEGTLSGDQVNVATATGDPTNPDGSPLPPTVSDPTDTDSATVDTVAPAIDLVKTVSTDGTCSGDPAIYGETGDAITYCFEATNTGDTELVNITVNDTTLGLTTADLTVVSGSLAVLPVGDTVTLSYASTIAGNLINSATAAGTPADGSGNPLSDVDPVEDSDQASVSQAAAAIQLTKTVSTTGTCPGVGFAEVGSGAPVTWCITVTNTGDTHLSGLELSDMQLGLTPANQATMASPDPATITLAPGSSSSLTGESATFAVAGTASDDLTNSASVVATPSDSAGDPLPGSSDPVTDDDTAEVDVLVPAINIDKTVSADGTCPGVDSIAAGNSFTATYCFDVTNTGDTQLGNIEIDDPLLGVTTADLTLIDITDDDNAMPLAVGGVARYSVESTVDGDLLNTATTTADPLNGAGDPLPGPNGDPMPPVTDSDIATVLEADSAVAIVKTVYAGHDGSAGCPGTESVSVDENDAITYCFTVVNTDAANHLSNVTVDDSTLGLTTADLTVVSGDPSDLAPGDSVVFSYETNATSDLVNTASTTGDPTGPSGSPLPGVEKPTDDDTASVDVAGPEITIVKAGYLGHDGGAQCPGTDPLQGTQGQQMTWCFFVTNTGDTALIDVIVDDPDLGLQLTHAGILQPGTSVTLHHETVLDEDLTNTASTTGTPSSPTGDPLVDVDPPTDSDTGVVDVVTPLMDVNKTVYSGHTAGVDCSGKEKLVADHGADVTWCVTITNNGDVALGDLELVDAALELTTADFTIAEGWTPLEPGATIVFYAEGEVDDSMVNEVIVTATPYGDPEGIPIPGTDPIERIDTATLERTPFDLVIVKTLAGSSGAQRTASWDLEVTNNGPGVAAAPITVVDPLPSTLSYISAAGSGFVCESGQTVTCVLDTDLTVGQSASLRIETSISNSARGVINNVATVSSPLGNDPVTGETTLANNNSAAPVTITESGQVAFTGSSTDTMVRLALGLIAIGLLFMAFNIRARRENELEIT